MCDKANNHRDSEKAMTGGNPLLSEKNFSCKQIFFFLLRPLPGREQPCTRKTYIWRIWEIHSEVEWIHIALFLSLETCIKIY